MSLNAREKAQLAQGVNQIIYTIKRHSLFAPYLRQ